MHRPLGSDSQPGCQALPYAGRAGPAMPSVWQMINRVEKCCVRKTFEVRILVYFIYSGEIVRGGIGQSTKRCTLVVEAERYHKDKDGLKMIDHDDDSKLEILIRVPSSCCSSVA